MKLSVRLLALAWVCLASVANAGSISGVLVFGDSLSDTGNLHAVLGKPDPPYFDGRYSNGLLWHEYLAQKLGVPVAKHSLGGGSNEAWAGAESGILLAPLGVPNVLTQVAARLLIKPSVDPSQLVAIWTGGNDYLFGDLDPNQSFPDPAKIVLNIEVAITALALAGGKNFLVPNLPLLGNSPIIAEKGQPGDAQKINDSVLIYNSLLATKLSALESFLGVTIH